MRKGPVQRSLFDAPQGEPAVPVKEPGPLSVSELVQGLQRTLEGAWPRAWVEGEISNLATPGSGHAYFTLKDDKSQLSVVMYRSRFRLLRFKLEHGMAVSARGAVSIYAARGDLQLIADSLEPRGQGALLLAFEQLKAKLKAEGLFAEELKRPLPLLPRRIGIVTSPTGAALRDMLNVIGRRHGNVRLLISPTRVQGEGAAREITAALKRVCRAPDVDVVIVGRGGGSLEDLWEFNDERLARAIAAAPVPVISAVGHETDYTIADFVADLRAPTPSAAAELVVNTSSELERRLAEASRRLVSALHLKVSRARLRLTELASKRALTAAASLPARHLQHIDDLAARLNRSIKRQLELKRARLDAVERSLEVCNVASRLARQRERRLALSQRLDRAVEQRVTATRSKLAELSASLEALSPYNVLQRGYAIATDAAGRVLREAEAVAIDDTVRVRLHRGSLRATVTKREESD